MGVRAWSTSTGFILASKTWRMTRLALFSINFLCVCSGLRNYRQEVPICTSQACLRIHTLFTRRNTWGTLTVVGIVAIKAFVARTLITRSTIWFWTCHALTIDLNSPQRTKTMILTISCIGNAVISRKYQTLRALAACCHIVTFIATQEAFLLADKTVVDFLQLVSVSTGSAFSSKARLTTSGTPNTSIAEKLESVLTAQTLGDVLRITAATAASQTLDAFPIVS